MGQPLKRSRVTVVALHPDVLDNILVWAALKWSGYIGRYREQHESHEDFIARIKIVGSVVLMVSGYDPADHFGPTLTLDSESKTIELTIPWRQVLAVTKGQANELEIGFRGEGGKPVPKATVKKGQ